MTAHTVPSDTWGRRPSEGHGRRLTAAFDALEAFPALAESRNRVLSVVRDDNPSTGDVVAAVESDCSLVITVLRMANRLGGRKRGKITSVPKAVEALTPEGVDALVSRAATFDFFERSPGWDNAPERFRLHAVATQSAADRVARVLEYPDRDELLVSALLHDVGKLVLIHAYPAYPEQIHGEARTPEERVKRERRELGVDHALVGGVLARRWGLPDRLARAIERHHSEDAEGEAAFVRLADMLAHYGHGQNVDPPRCPHARSRCSSAWPRARSTSRSPTSSTSPPPRCARTCTTPTPSSARWTRAQAVLIATERGWL